MPDDATTLDRDALRTVLAREVGGDGPLEVEPLGGGRANETLRIGWGSETYVLRHPLVDDPAPGVPHGVDREAAALQAVEGAKIPAPRVVVPPDRTRPLDVPALIVEHVEGDVPEDAEPERLAEPKHRTRLADELVAVLARIHDQHEGDVDRPVGPVTPERALERVRDQLDWARQTTDERRPLPTLEAVLDELADDPPPAGETTLIHGDYKPDNLMLAPGLPPRVAAVLDWEMAGPGDPLLDLGWLLSYWQADEDTNPLNDDLEDRFGEHPAWPVAEAFVAEYAAFTARSGYPTRGGLADAYEEATGRHLDRPDWYRALAVARLAAICEGFLRLHLEGSPAAKPVYPAMEVIVPLLGQRARLVLDGQEPL